MSIAFKRYEDDTFIPLSKPWSRRVEYGPQPKKKRSIVRRAVSKLLDNAANGIIRGTGSKDVY